MKEAGKIVTGCLDSHAVGTIVLSYIFEKAGFKVSRLSTLVSPEEFIKAAIEADADAIMISSVCGHGEIDCREFREKCKEAGIGDILIYIGGNLKVGKQDWNETEKLYEKMGFDRVFPPGADLEKAVRDLKRDLRIRRSKQKGVNP